MIRAYRIESSTTLAIICDRLGTLPFFNFSRCTVFISISDLLFAVADETEDCTAPIACLYLKVASQEFERLSVCYWWAYQVEGNRSCVVCHWFVLVKKVFTRLRKK